jgi:hypothetical protein
MHVLLRGSTPFRSRCQAGWYSPSTAVRQWMRRLAALALLCGAGIGLVAAQTSTPPPPDPAPVASPWSAPEPWRTDRFYLETSLYTRHWHSDPAHVDHQKLILGEWNLTEQWLLGASVFDNSFGQPSQYVYGGYRWRPFDALQPFYVKVSAGLVHGYKDEFRDKIPLNHAGIAPVIVPSLGYCINRLCSELVVFGGAGVLLTLGVTIP